MMSFDGLYNLASRVYDENNHPYHNIKHIRDMIEIAADFDLPISRTQKLAILFHDIIYMPFAKNNEEQSVKKMKSFFTLEDLSCYEREIIAKASEIIMDTKTHIATIEESKTVIDLDLVSLGYTLEVFNITSELIYIENWKVANANKITKANFDEIFYKETIEFAKIMLNRGREIYYNEIFNKRFNEQAHNNLEHMIDDCTNKLKNMSHKKENGNVVI